MITIAQAEREYREYLYDIEEPDIYDDYLGTDEESETLWALDSWDPDWCQGVIVYCRYPYFRLRDRL